jgi:hypothetical protein
VYRVLDTLGSTAVLFDDMVTQVVSITSADSPYAARDDDHTIFVDTSGGAVTVTLTPAAAITGREYIIKKTTGDANAITIDPNGAETIDGAATHVFGGAVAMDSRTVQSDGTSWWVTQGGIT